jgi:hypothetical protein
MATYAKFDATKPVNYARAVRGRPANQESRQSLLLNPLTLLVNASGLDAVLNARYKAGGSTTWERPAATG